MSMENGSTKYLSQLENYVSGKSKNKRSWNAYVAIVDINIYLHNKENIYSILSNLQINFVRIDLPKMDQHTGGKWLFYDPKHCKDN